jgi:lysyl-tRNA synthetase, class II
VARANYHDLIKQVAGDDFFDITPEQRRAKCDELGVQISEPWKTTRSSSRSSKRRSRSTPSIPASSPAWPAELVPLAKVTPGGKTVEVYELIINGQEISPGYSELNDPDVQRQRLEHQAGGEEEQKVDYDFIETLEHGMPPPAASASASTASS